MASAIQRLKILEETERLESSLIEFYRAAWPIFDPAPYVHGWHLEAIAEHLEAVSRGDIRKLLITMPPRHSKTLMASVVWPAWLWAKERDQKFPLVGAQTRFLCLSYGDDLALDSALLMRRLIESEWYQSRWGKRVKLQSDQEAKSKFDTTAGGSRISAGFGGTLTGRGGDIKICFPGDELVLTKTGWKPIGQLVATRSKDQVRSLNLATGTERWTDVVGWHTNPGADIYEVVLSDGSAVRCTGDHRILTINRGWVCADALEASDRLPMVSSLADVHDVLVGHSHPSGNCSVRFGRVHDFVDLLRRCFVDGPNALIGRQSHAVRNMRPCFSPADLTDHTDANAVFRSNNFGGIGSGGNLSSILLGKKSARALGANWESSVSLGIRNVLRSSAICKIVDAIVARVSVQVTDFMPLWAWTYKRFSSSYVDVSKRYFSVLAARNAVVSVSVFRQFQNFVRDWKGCPVPAHGNAGKASGASKIGYFVPWTPIYRTPVLVRKVGFAHETFCITVDGDSNFIAGKGRGVIVSNCDDPLKADDENSEIKRLAVLRRYDGTLKSRITDPRTNAEVVIAQRLHEQDLPGHILDTDPDFEHLMLPAEFETARRFHTSIGWTDPRTEEGELLWPERFGRKELAQYKVNPYEWAGQWQQRPEVRGGSIIKREWWQDYTTDDGKVPACTYVVASLDPAYTQKQENDPSGFTVWGVWYDDRGHSRIICLNAWRKRLELHGPHIDRNPGETEPQFIKRTQAGWGLIEWVHHSCKRFRVDKLLVESKASGLSVAQEIRRLHSGQGYGVELIDPKGQDKVARCYAVQHLFSEGMIHLPAYSDGSYREWGQMLVDEFASFPKGATDDLVDSSTQALKHIRDRGLAVRRDERAAEEFASRRHKPKSSPLYPS